MCILYFKRFKALSYNIAAVVCTITCDAGIIYYDKSYTHSESILVALIPDPRE